jgi:hypothetical protein
MSASSHVAVLTSSLSQGLGNVVVSLKTRGESQAHRPGKMTREVTRSLRLRPRGAIAHDVLHLAALSLRLRVEWRARDVHPWNHDLSTQRQAQRRQTRAGLGTAASCRVRVCSVGSVVQCPGADAPLGAWHEESRRFP